MPKIQYYIDHRNQRESQILNILQSNKNTSYTELDLVKLIYTETPEHLWPAAANNVSQHLKKMLKEKRIQSEEQTTFDGNMCVVWKCKL